MQPGDGFYGDLLLAAADKTADRPSLTMFNGDRPLLTATNGGDSRLSPGETVPEGATGRQSP